MPSNHTFTPDTQYPLGSHPHPSLPPQRGKEPELKKCKLLRRHDIQYIVSEIN